MVWLVGILVAVEMCLQCFQKLILVETANLAKLSPICHCSIPGYVWEACQSIHWINRDERKQSILCVLACGVIGGC